RAMKTSNSFTKMIHELLKLRKTVYKKKGCPQLYNLRTIPVVALQQTIVSKMEIPNEHDQVVW
ncbi:hypothetical protein L9F63_016571, partial [Diploptera punctata]